MGGASASRSPASGLVCFGIDPGSRKTGWGAVRLSGARRELIDFGVVRLPERAHLAERLRILFAELSERLRACGPACVSLESVFQHRSVRSALVLGQARGVALLAAAQASVPIVEISPAEVKKGVTGSGRADKAQVQAMVRVILGMSKTAPEDASDALAVAMAGAQKHQFEARMGQGGRSP